jgi:hypothetical protein
MTEIQKENVQRVAAGMKSLPTLRDLRKMSQEIRVHIYRQSGAWIVSRWSPALRLWQTDQLHYSHDTSCERIVLAMVLGV